MPGAGTARPRRRRRSEGDVPTPNLLLSCPAGTFITEWKEGGQLCEAFLGGDDRSYQAVADRLVLMAQFLRFDGWLINIENSLSVSTAFLVAPVQPSPCCHGCPSTVSLASPRLACTQARSLLQQLGPLLASQ